MNHSVFVQSLRYVTILSAATLFMQNSVAHADSKLAEKVPSGPVALEDDFEAGDETPANWEQGAPVPGVKYFWDVRAKVSGKRSLALRKTANRYFPIAQWSRTFPREGELPALQVAVQVKAVKAGKATLDVVFLDDNGQMLSHEWVAYIGAKNDGDKPANHDWKEYAGAVAIPAEAKQIMFALQIYGPGSVWFDDLKATYATSIDAKPDNAEKQPSTAGEAPSEAAPAAEPIAIEVKPGAKGRYLLAAPAEKSSDPRGLLIVLPGGDGSADFHPFVRNIQRHALGGEYLIAQPLAEKWTPDQYVTWPTAGNKVAGMKFTTEELVGKVIEHVGAQHVVDPKRTYLLAWSSGGPAAYATLLQNESPAAGALIAMSVFKPKELPPLKQAAKRRFYILHSPDDATCPYPMAQQAAKVLAAAGAETTLVDYEGGHGWQGDIFGSIRQGIGWLEKP